MPRYNYQAENARLREVLEKERREIAATLDAVIDAFGIRAEYPNVDREVERDRTSVNSQGHFIYYQPPVRTYGRDRFRADVALAAGAARGAEASARLTAALKAVK